LAWKIDFTESAHLLEGIAPLENPRTFEERIVGMEKVLKYLGLED